MINLLACKYPTWNHDFRVLTKFEKSTKTKRMENNSARVSMDEDDNEARSTKKVKTRPWGDKRYRRRTRGVSYMDTLLEVKGMQDKEIFLVMCMKHEHSLEYVCPDVRHASVSDTGTTSTPIITLNYVIFPNYHWYQSVVVDVVFRVFEPDVGVGSQKVEKNG
jgi:hypothetical protein